MLAHITRKAVFLMTPPSYSNLPARFWDKVEVQDSGCWEWQAGLDSNGYGQFHLNERKHLSTRLALKDSGVNIQGFLVLHKCDNRLCVNTNHLYTGSQQDNMNDAMERGRLMKGETHVRATLTEEKVAAIRKERITNGTEYKDIADMFSVTKNAAWKAAIGLTWKHVQGERASHVR